MKIALLLPEYYPNIIGGGAVIYKTLLEGYLEAKHEVLLIHGDYKMFLQLPRVEKTDNMHILSLAQYPYPKSSEYLKGVMPLTVVSTLYVLYYLIKFKPQVAHIHGYGLPSSNTFAFICRLLRIKYVFTLHGFPETQTSKNTLVRFVWALYDRIISRTALKNACRVTSVSLAVKNSPNNMAQYKTLVIPNALDMSELSIKKDVSVRRMFNLKDDTKILVSLGRIIKMKGFQDIIPKLKSFDGDVVYIIGGDDFGYKAELQKLIEQEGVSDRVIFAGFVESDVKASLIKQCDLFVIPSLNEPFGLVAPEAMYFGKPIWYRPSAGLKEALQNYENKITLAELPKLDTIKDITPPINLPIFDTKSMVTQYLEVLKNAS
jgi:glycosyltransferase involved in cell wall biosynthesis